MKKAIVTGAYGAIGLAVTEGLARSGMQVFMAGRDPHRLETAARVLNQRLKEELVVPVVLDLGSRLSIAGFAEHWQGELHLLINNAVTAPRVRTMTPEGMEMQFAVNVMGYWRMMTCLHPMMPAGSRIVNVASYWAGGLDLSDPEFVRRKYNNDAAYRQSKQADRMLTAAFASLLQPAGITVNACHPGDVNSKVSNDLGFGGFESPEQGAETPLWLALSPEVDHVSGKYFEQKQEKGCPFMQDREAVEALNRLCAAFDKYRE